MDKPMSQEEYARHRGGRCPACRGGDVKINVLDEDGFATVILAGCAFVLCQCKSCHARWEERYVLEGYGCLRERGEA